MDHTPEPSSPPPANRPAVDDVQLETLLRQSLAEHVAGISPSPNALPHLNARLDAARPLKRWPIPLRLAGAVAAALLLLAFLTPVGRLAAAGMHDAAQRIITTVKQIASGDNDASNTPPNVPSATGALGSRTAPTNDAGSPTTVGTVNPAPATSIRVPSGTPSQVSPRSPTPTPHVSAQPSGTAPSINTRLQNSPVAPTPTPTATEATTVSTSPTTAVGRTATPVSQRDAPAAKPAALLTATPVTHGPKTVEPPGRDPPKDAGKNRSTQCALLRDAPAACRKNAHR